MIDFSKIASVLVMVAGLAAAQPKFDVVSIHVRDPKAGMVVDPNLPDVRPGGVYVTQSTPLLFLLSFAYNIKDPALTLSGLPKWAEQTSFLISANAGSDFPKLSEAENNEQVRLMVRAMLEDRFRLKIHKESRSGAVMNLQLDKGGIRVPEIASPDREGRVDMAIGDSRGRMITVGGATMKGLVGGLAIFLKQPVIDKTGLTGFYSFDIQWKSDAPTASSGLGAEGLGMLISNLKDQLGLVLKKDSGMTDYWVVDSVEMPSEN
ncbi:MAG: TIGR03435 family protein [Bryobacteraceae bacterium]